MPKKFANENPKVVAARDRKATAKKDEADRKQKAAEDAYWADDDKLANRKLQRKDDEERKRLEAAKRKEENRKLAEAEMSSLGGKAAQPSAPKVTRATIEERKEAERKAREEEDKKAQLASQRLEVTEETSLAENINRLTVEEGATNVDDAIRALGGPNAEDDKHPEKRMKAAYLAFEEKMLPRLKDDHPTYRLSQLKQELKKMWQKSPENPLNARLLAMSSK